ncbi:MAG: exo-alpha-sialidase, partial [Verrucomicrobia bacterium]|nr:exo-alpha-sialidase [Verrucomicrobiota bacterium]
MKAIGLKNPGLGVAAAMLVAVASAPAAELELLRVARISGDAKHSAFTALARFNDAFYCAWREGSSHVSADGKLRVVRSADGTNWTPVALMTRAGADLRDAKLEVTPDKRLMLHGSEKFPDGSSPLRRNIAWFTTDGTTWTDPVTIAEDDIWFWKHTWHKGTGYGVGYACVPPYFTRLYTSKDAKKWTTHVATLNNSGYANVSSIVFMPDDTAHCLLRRDDGTRTALLGTAAPPYTSWTWQDLGRQIGGPELIRLPDNRLLAAVRQYPQATWLCWVSPKSGTLTPALKLPSGGDTSYAGMVWHDGRLWVSYYSSHEKRTSVYIAEVAYRPTIN